MRRFLDWTAAQTGAGGATGGAQSSASNTSGRRNSSSQYSHHHHHQSHSQMGQPNNNNNSNNQATSSTLLQQSSAAALLPTTSTTNNPARDLEIQHLTKLLHEIKYYQASSSPLPSAAGSQNQREFVDKVHRTLPLFLNVFGATNTSPTATTNTTSGGSCQSSVDQVDNNSSSYCESTSSSKPNSPLAQRSPQMDRFPDLLPFAFTIARLFVSEVRQRASNKHAEDASLAILQFLNFRPPPPPLQQLSTPRKETPPTATNATTTTTTAGSGDKSSEGQMQPDACQVEEGVEATREAETARGWNLLLSLNTLALSQTTSIKPSAPANEDGAADKRQQQPDNNNQQQSSSDYSFANEITSGPLIKAFTQLLVRLCSNQCAVDELIKKDDLRLLIGIASSQCSRHNRPWRKTAFQTLLAISKNMRDHFMYLEQNLCIQVYVDNMHRINSLGLVSTEEFVDMIRTLLEFLYNLDVNNRNQPRCIAPLIEQFKASRIIELMEELICKIDDTIMQESKPNPPSPIFIGGGGSDSKEVTSNQQHVCQQASVSSEAGLRTDEYRRYGRRMIQSLTVMAKINISHESMANILTLKPLAMSRFEMLEQFKMPRPSARNCIFNFEALRLLKFAWSKCRDSHIIEAILDTTISLFNDDKYNYFIFESQQLLIYYMTSCNFKLFPYKVKQKLFKFLEFIIIETNYIPCLELGTIGTIIKISSSSSSGTDLILGLKTLIACLRFNSKFSDIFREIGLLEIIVELLIRTMQQDNLGQSTEKLEALYLLLEASQYLLAGPNNLNCTQFNESGAARHVFNCLSKPEFFHLFVPAHSSSSDDSAAAGPASGTGTPLSKSQPAAAQQQQATIYSNNQNQWLENAPLAQHLSSNKPSIKQLQKVAFTIIRQLVLSTAGDEHLANLLGLLARNLDDLKSFDGSSEGMDDNASAANISQARLDFAFLIAQEVNLKICILKSLMIILKDSHRCRTLFRKAGGFIYIVSALVILEKSLPSYELSQVNENELESHNLWRKVNTRRIWRLIKNSLITIVVAIRFEPANLRAFSEDVIDKFTEAIRRLGCFKSDQIALKSSTSTTRSDNGTIENFNSYRSIFLAPPTRDLSTIANDSTRPNEACCQLFRFLYDMSLNMGDGTAELEFQLERHAPLPVAHLNHHHQHHNSHHHHHHHHQGSHDSKSISFDQGTSTQMSSSNESILNRRSQLNMAPKRPPSLDLNARSAEPAILTFPCIIITILDLIPSCPSEDLMVFICLVIKSLFKHERNQQMLCEAGMLSKLLNANWRLSITDKGHFLHELTEFMLEKLAKQNITAKELRMFLRLGDPLRCKNLDDIEVTESSEETKQKLCESSNKDSPIETPSRKPKEKILTDRIEAFVAMMSNERAKMQPPFIEFDMSTDGLSSIFMPSIAPINAKSLPPNSSSFLNSTLDVHTSEKNGILGGVGAAERQFPPTTGLTFSTWICIEKFPARSPDASHNLRLLTIYRGSAATGKEYSCFRIQISALDRALTVSTQEVLLFDNENRADAQHDPDCNLRIWTPELLNEGKWHHIAITMNRSLLKQSVINVYIDGALAHQQRICYIGSYVGTTNSGPLGTSNANNTTGSAAAFVNAFIGSLPQLRFQLRTQWKQGPCHLIEEQLSANFISVIYALGPNFIGNYQSSQKLNEFARLKGVQHSQHVKYHRSADSKNHRPLKHQQSAAVVHSAHAMPLTRISSSTVGTSSEIGVVHQISSSSSSSHNQYFLAEDRVLMSVDARATSLMTLSRMRRIYTRFDCRQVSRVLGLALHENSTPILLLHNTGVHLNGPSRGIGAVTIGYNHVRYFVPSPTQHTLFNIGGSYILLGLVAQAETVDSFSVSLRSLVCALKHNTKLQAQMDNINGYQILSVFFWKKKHLLNPSTLKLTFSLITDNLKTYGDDNEMAVPTRSIQQVGALRDLVCECFDLWLQTDMILLVLEFIYDLIRSSNQEQAINLISASNHIRMKNLKCLRDMDLLPRMLRLLPQYDSQQVDSSIILDPGMKSILDSNSNQSVTDSLDTLSSRAFDTKAIYLIKQTVFELLNRTPRQSDILYFGQFLASLLPSNDKERQHQAISLRNILLKSLLQMMTNNKQKEVNNAMQEELVRILGFDWFMLFISGSHLDSETITIGFFNLMVILSNDDLYTNFKTRPSSNGGWLKEPTFPTIDGKFNIQLLGINVGVFFGLSGKKKSIKHEVLEAPNFFLLGHCLSNLVELPRIYLMIFQTMMSRFTKLDTSVFDTIETFDKLSLDILCDCLVGDTHHKRRQTLAGIQFKCHELVVSLVYMLRDIMCEYASPTPNESQQQQQQQHQHDQYPADVIRFLMYLYNNNLEFQHYCRKSDELMDALCETLMKSEGTTSDGGTPRPAADKAAFRLMTEHPASKEVIELSQLIILDTMTDPSQSPAGEMSVVDQLHAFERFLDGLSCCKEAQGELVDMLLRQILLMIDSTARHNTIKTLAGSENIMQFQLLLINSISISQIVTDKIWLNELYPDNLNRVLIIIDHQLCLAEQIFKFNEILPKHNPPHAFIMQRVLNRLLLFALSRPMQHISDKMLVLDLLKKIHDNRTIIILNHMHSPQSAEFFVCFAFCLMKIIEDNSGPPTSSKQHYQQSASTDQPSSLIERQYGHPSLSHAQSMNEPSSSSLVLVSMARKVWDAIYQSKKGILSEALDVSLSLPAFTLDTSLDLLQLKPDINDSCERYWSSFIEMEQKPKRRLQQRQSEPSPGTSASTAVNILSGRLTRVVNAASFVSRVVGATAGTMASNVNLVGEKLTQGNRSNRRDLGATRSASEVITTATASNILAQSTASGQGGQSSGPGGGAQTPHGEQSELFKYPSLNKHHIEEASQTHISIIEDYIESQLSQKNHKLALHRYLCDEWLDTEYEVLLRERALFGPDYGSKLDKWCLDMTEGPRRMRKKMVNNSKQFYEHYAYTPEQYNPSNKSLRYRPPMSYDSYLYYMKTLNLDEHLLELSDKQLASDRVFSEKNNSVEEEGEGNGSMRQQQQQSLSQASIEKPTKLDLETTSKQQAVAINVDCPSPVKSASRHHSSLESFPSPTSSRLEAGPSSPRPSEGEPDDGDSTSFVDFSPEIEAETKSENVDSLSVLRLLEKNERISHMFRCSRIQGLDTHEGLLLFGREHFYLIDGFTLLKTREIKDIDSLPPDAHDPIIPNSTPIVLAHSKKTCAKFSFDSVVEVHKRRYLLQPIALEVFSSDGRNTLIVFPRNIRNKVYSRLMTVSTQLTSNAHESLAGQKSNVSVEGGSGLLSNLIGETSVTQRWVRGELSNFQYLMNLNTIAGRSYNDLMQYPIFPWILADYSSDHLDLGKPSTFRDLSRPVGAQTSERLEQFKRRYADWDDTETPPYHYGTFYSSAMIVASYLVRMEPFTQHFLRLQGGHFDLADRMFHSIHDSWLSASKHNMADIKELVPEFFYLPEFLNNSNKYDLGIKQNGMKLDDVKLPPWAKNDPREFIRQHRCALESDYVSAHLHEWIDLIFGYKQQGQAAVDAVNVFHHLFYEGNVDIYNTDIDPIKKNAVIGFINNFGQVPKQLFKKPHPARKVTSSGLSSAPASIPLTPILPSLSAGSGAHYNQKVITHCPEALKPATNTTLKDLRGPVGQIVQIDKNIVAVEQNKLLIPPEYCRYVAWGHADRSLRLGLYESEKPIFVWEGSANMSPNEILCCTMPNNRTMITAGTESLITIWKIEKMKSFAPVMNLYGHVEPVTCLASSQSYGLIVSGSRDRTAIIWDLNRFTFVRQLGGRPEDKLVHHGPVSTVAINDSTGDIATCASSWLYLWSINGELLASIDSLSVTIQQSMCGNSSISSNLGQLHILSVCFSQNNEWDLDEVIVTGASDGSVALWSMRYYQSPLSRAELEEEARSKEERQLKQDKQEEEEEEERQQMLKQPEEQQDSKEHHSTELNTLPATETAREVEVRTNASEPIAIRQGRQRTDTMNSEWVKLSTSSTSTIDTLPMMKATPTSLSEQANELFLGADLHISGESYADGDSPCSLLDHRDSKLTSPSGDDDGNRPMCSTPVPQSGGEEEDDPEVAKETLSASLGDTTRDKDLSMGDLSTTTNRGGDEPDGHSLSKANLLITPNDPSLLKFSKSDTSLVDSFVILGHSPGSAGQSGGVFGHQANQPNERARPQSSTGVHTSIATPVQRAPRRLPPPSGHRGSGRRSSKSAHKLLPNHCWRRELYLRMLLPRRNAKMAPSAVTSLAISKDHRTIFVGEASGKISSWSTT